MMFGVKPIVFEAAPDMGSEFGDVQQGVTPFGTYFYHNDTRQLIFTSRELGDLHFLSTDIDYQNARIMAQGHLQALLSQVLEPFFTDQEVENQPVEVALQILVGWLDVSKAPNGLAFTMTLTDERRAEVEVRWVNGKSSGEIIEELREKAASAGMEFHTESPLNSYDNFVPGRRGVSG